MWGDTAKVNVVRAFWPNVFFLIHFLLEKVHSFVHSFSLVNNRDLPFCVWDHGQSFVLLQWPRIFCALNFDLARPSEPQHLQAIVHFFKYKIIVSDWLIWAQHRKPLSSNAAPRDFWCLIVGCLREVSRSSNYDKRPREIVIWKRVISVQFRGCFKVYP